jgi:hypothetical protein
MMAPIASYCSSRLNLQLPLLLWLSIEVKAGPACCRRLIYSAPLSPLKVAPNQLLLVAIVSKAGR